MSYTIDININQEQLEILNETIENGLINFTKAALALGTISRKIKDGALFTNEIDQIKLSISKLTNDFNVETAKGISSVVNSLNVISERLNTAANGLEKADPSTVSKINSDISQSILSISEGIRTAVTALNIKVEGILAGVINLEASKATIAAVNIDLVTVESAEGIIKNLVEIDTVTVREAEGIIKNPIAVISKTDSSKTIIEPVKVAAKGQETLNLNKTTNTSFIAQLRAVGDELVKTLNQINGDVIKSGAGLKTALNNLIADLAISGNISADTIIGNITFDNIDLTEIIKSKIDASGLNEVINKNQSKPDDSFQPLDVKEQIQALGLENEINEFARFLQDATGTLDGVNADFNLSATRLGVVSKRIQALAQSTVGFDSLAIGVRQTTANVSEALANLNIVLRNFNSSGISNMPNNQDTQDLGGTSKKDAPRVLSDILAEEFNKVNSVRGASGIAQAFTGLTSVFLAQEAEGKRTGTTPTLNDLNKNGSQSADLISAIKGAISSSGLPRTPEKVKAALDENPKAFKSYTESYSSYNRENAALSLDDVRDMIRVAISALKADKNTDKNLIKELEKAAQEKLGNRLDGKGYLKGQDTPAGGAFKTFNTGDINSISLGTDTFEASAFKDAADKLIISATETGKQAILTNFKYLIKMVSGLSEDVISGKAVEGIKAVPGNIRQANKDFGDRVAAKSKPQKKLEQTPDVETEPPSERPKPVRKTKPSNANPIPSTPSADNNPPQPSNPNSPSDSPNPNPYSPKTKQAPPNPPQPPKTKQEPLEEKPENDYFYDLKKAKNKLKRQPSLKNIESFPDAEDDKYYWEDQKQLNLALDDAATLRHTNLQALLNKLKSLEGQSRARGDSDSARTIELAAEITKVAKVFEASSKLGQDSNDRITKTNDTNLVNKAKFSVGSSKLDDKLPTKTLEQLLKGVESEEAKLQIKQLYAGYVKFFDKGDSALKKRITKELNQLKSLVNSEAQVGNDLSDKVVSLSSSNEEEKVLVTLYNQRAAKLLKDKKNKETKDTRSATKEQYLTELERIEEEGLSSKTVPSIPAAPEGFRELKEKRNAVLNRLSKNFALDFKLEIGNIIDEGANYSVISEKLSSNKQNLGKEFQDVEKLVASKIKTRLDKLINTANRDNKQKLDTVEDYPPEMVPDGVVARDYVKDINGAEYPKEYEEYITSKVEPETEKNKKIAIKRNQKALLKKVEKGEDYSKELDVIRKLDPFYTPDSPEKTETSLKKFFAQRNKKIKEAIDEQNKDVFNGLIFSPRNKVTTEERSDFIDQFKTKTSEILTKEADELVKAKLFDQAKTKYNQAEAERPNSALSNPSLQLQIALDELTEKQISYYKKLYYIARNAGKSTEAQTELAKLEEIAPDIAEGIKRRDNKPTSVTSVGANISKARDFILLDKTSDDEYQKLLVTIEAQDANKAEVLRRYATRVKISQLTKSIEEKILLRQNPSKQIQELEAISPAKAREVNNKLSSNFLSKDNKLIQKLMLELKNAVDSGKSSLVRQIQNDIKLINEQVGISVTTDSNAKLIRVLYKQLLEAYDQGNQSRIDSIGQQLIDLNSGSSKEKAKSTSENAKLKPLLKTLSQAKQNLELDLINSTLAQIRQISPVAATEAVKGSKKTLLAILNQRLLVALDKLDFATAETIAQKIKSVNGVLAGIEANKKIKSKINSSSFVEADQVFNQIKREFSEPTREKVDSLREVKVTEKELKLGNVSGKEAVNQAEKLVLAVNNFLKNNIAAFDNQQLREAKRAAQLGNLDKLTNLNNLTNITNKDDVSIAYKSAIEAESKVNNGLNDTQKGIRQKLNAQMLAAITDTTDDKQKLIAEALKAIQAVRDKNEVLSNQAEEDKKKNIPNNYENLIPDGGLMDDTLKTISNRGLKAQTTVDRTENPFKIQDLAGTFYTVQNLFRNIREFVTGVIQAASSVNTELLRLNIVNSGNSKRTAEDIRQASEISKKYGGSLASSLSSLANFKTADILQYNKFGESQGQRFGQKEVSGLVEGLNAAYNVNQLSTARRNDANAAVTQIFSKGVVNSEELKRQLSNQIPGAVPLFGQSLGVSSGQLTKRLERNEVADTELFKFGILLKQLFSAAASDVNLNNETFKLEGKAQDFTNAATQPVGAVLLPAMQLLNATLDGLKSNAGALVLGMTSLAAVMSKLLITGIANSFSQDSILGKLGQGTKDELNKNKVNYGMIGGGIALASVGSALVGTDGLDTTLGNFAKNLGLAVSSIANFITGFDKWKEKPKDDETAPKLKDNPFIKFLFELAPLAALLFPLVSFARNSQLVQSFIPTAKSTATTVVEKAKEIGSGIKAGASSFVAGGGLIDLGLSIATASAAYAIANTKFISEYTETTEALIRKLSKIGKNDGEDRNSQLARFEEAKKQQGTESFNLDTTGQYFRDNLSPLSQISNNRLEQIIKPESAQSYEPKYLEAAKEEYENRLKNGFQLKSGFSGDANEKSKQTDLRAVETIIKRSDEFLDDDSYKLEREKADLLKKQIAIEKRKLNKITEFGLVEVNGKDQKQDANSFDEQKDKVKKLEAEYRQKITSIPLRVGGLSQNIQVTEELIESIKSNQGYDEITKYGENNPDGTRGSGGIIGQLKKNIEQIKLRLPNIEKESVLYDPTKAVSQGVILNEERLAVAAREDTNNRSSYLNDQVVSSTQRFSETNDRAKETRDAANATRNAEVEYKSKLEKANIAVENARLTRELPSDSGTVQRDKLEKALNEETAALEALKAATLGLTQAQLSQQQLLESNLNKEFERALKNYARQDKDIKTNPTSTALPLKNNPIQTTFEPNKVSTGLKEKENTGFKDKENTPGLNQGQARFFETRIIELPQYEKVNYKELLKEYDKKVNPEPEAKKLNPLETATTILKGDQLPKKPRKIINENLAPETNRFLTEIERETKRETKEKEANNINQSIISNIPEKKYLEIFHSFKTNSIKDFDSSVLKAFDSFKDSLPKKEVVKPVSTEKEKPLVAPITFKPSETEVIKTYYDKLNQQSQLKTPPEPIYTYPKDQRDAYLKQLKEPKPFVEPKDTEQFKAIQANPTALTPTVDTSQKGYTNVSYAGKNITITDKADNISQEEYDKNLKASLEQIYFGKNAFNAPPQKNAPKATGTITDLYPNNNPDGSLKTKTTSQPSTVAPEPLKQTPVVKKVTAPTFDGSNASKGEIIKVGTVDKALYALDYFKANIDKFKLSAEEASDKLVELRTNLVTTTLNYLEQQRQQQSDRFEANNLFRPQFKQFQTYVDTSNSLKQSEASKIFALNQNQGSINDTKKALSFKDIDPTERANLAIKLIALETENIKKKHEVEMAGIERTKAAYSNLQDVIASKISIALASLESNNLGNKQKREDKKDIKNDRTNSVGATVGEGAKLIEEVAKVKDINEGKANQRETAQRTAINSINPSSASVKELETLAAQPREEIVRTLKFFETFQRDQRDGKESPNNTVSFDQVKYKSEEIDGIIKVFNVLIRNKDEEKSDKKDLYTAQSSLKKYNASVLKENRQLDREVSSANLKNTEEKKLIPLTKKVNSTKADGLKSDFIANRNKLSQNPNNKITTLINEFNLEIERSQSNIRLAKDGNNKLKEQLEESTIDRLPIEAARDKKKVTADALKNINSQELEQKKIIEKAGIELITTIYGLSSTLENALEKVNSKLQDAASAINQTQTIIDGIGGFSDGKIADVVPKIIKDPITKRDVVSQELEVINYNPLIQGDKEKAKLYMDVLKSNRNIDAQLLGLNQIKDNKDITIDPNNIKKSSSYQLQSQETKKKIDETINLVNSGKVTPEQFGGILEELYEELKAAKLNFSKLSIPQAKREENKRSITSNEIQIQELAAEKKRLETSIEKSSFGVINQVDDITIKLRRLEKEKIQLQYVEETTAPGATDETKRVSENKRKLGISAVEEQSQRMDEYGGRFVNKVQEAVETASNISAAFRKAIEEGDWRYVLGDILAGIANNLADSYAKDAAANLGGLVKAGLGGLLGLVSGSTGLLGASMSSQSAIPSYSQGNINQFGLMGSQFPKTSTQDPREPSQSHLAIINKDELVLSAEMTRDYLGAARVNSAMASVIPNQTLNTSSSSDTHNYFNYSNYQQSTDSFQRNATISGAERDREVSRLSKG